MSAGNDRRYAAFKAAFDRFDKGGYIARADLRKCIDIAAVPQTSGEFLETLETLDPHRDGKLPKKATLKFFYKKLNRDKSSSYNRLLLKSVIGQPKHSSYDLPGEYHTYGAKVPRDAEGSKEVILTWKPFQAQNTEEKQLNIVKMNKRAIRKNCLTAAAMTDYNQRNPIYDTKVMKSHKTTSTKEMLAGSKSLQNGKAFGITKRASTPIRDLVCGKYNEDYDQSRGEPFYPQNNASVNRIKQKTNKKTFDGTRPTKASVGHSLNARKMNERPKPRFKMQRFKNVKARVKSNLSNTGQRIVDGPADDGPAEEEWSVGSG